MHNFELPPAKVKRLSKPKNAPGSKRSDHAERKVNLQHSIGNQAAQRSKRAADSTAKSNLQHNLTLSSPADPHEREADRVAEQVLTMPQAKGSPSGAHGNNEKGIGRSRQINPAALSAPPAIREVLQTPGVPLDETTRAFMEPRFNHDFSRVRVHVGKAAEESAISVNAAAYTVGNSIVFGRGRYAPGAADGRRLIAHELSHVVQQTADGPGTVGLGLRLQRQTVDPRTFKPDTITEPRHVRYSEWLIESTPSGPVHTEVYWIDFEVDDKGVMRASARTVSDDRAHRSGTLRLGEKFNTALEYFDKSGVKVNTFEGDWSWMSPSEISENLKVFRESMAAGKTREQAARDTPSGKVAEKAGFEIFNVENVPESQEHLAEEGVRKWRVKAQFRRTNKIPGPAGGVSSPPSPTPGTGTGTTEVKAEVGAPLKPIAEGTPGFNPEAGAGFAGAFQILQAKQVGNLQQDEIAKYEKRYAQLQPKINAWFAAGYSVELTCIVEKPKRPDFFCAAGTYCDSDQIVFFHDLYISRVTSMTAVTTTYTTSSPMQVMSAPGGATALYRTCIRVDLSMRIGRFQRCKLVTQTIIALPAN